MDSAWDMDSETRLLLHLLRFSGYKEEYVVPVEITQRGISEAIGVKLTHVSRLTRSLISSGMIEEKKAHVQGIQRRVKVYFLTKKGEEKAEEIMRNLEKISFIAIMDGKEQELTYKEIKGRTSSSILEIAEMLKKEGKVDMDALEPPPVGTFLAFHPPEIEFFVGRKREIKEISLLLENQDIKILIIYGNPGYGKSSLLFHTLRGFSGRANLLWLPVSRKSRLTDILNPTSSFLSSLGKSGLEPLIFEKRPMEDIVKAIVSRLKGTESILVFDGYEEMRDEVVEFFMQLLHEIESSEGIKIVLTAREDTPYYSRFYGPADVDRGVVYEYHLSGLNTEETAEFLGTNNMDAVKKIHLLTKGNPRLLRMIKNRDAEGLKSTGRFSIEEIKMLLYLAEKG